MPRSKLSIAVVATLASLVVAAAAFALVAVTGFAASPVQPPERHAVPASSVASSGASRAAPVESRPETQTAASPAPIPPVPAPIQRSAPVHISIPSISVTANLGPARGLTAAHTITDAPLTGPIWDLPWWLSTGPAPGQDGSAAIIGHVDSAIGAGHLGVFFRLGNLAPGTTIGVTLADGATTNWVVTSDVLYPDSSFPDASVYAKTGPPTLRLITCGGAFDETTHLYESAVVITAREV